MTESTAEHAPRRSALFMPASNARALDKARELPADVVIFDLEDAVAPDAKAAARDRAAAAAAGGGYGRRQVMIRINGAGTPWWADDIAAVATAGIGGVVLPKVDSGDTVRAAAAALDAAGGPAGPAGPALWCMVETPRGVLRAAEIAEASPRVAGLIMGTSDLTSDLRARATPGREALLASLGLCVLAARAAGVAILDGVHLDLDDTAGFEAACRQGAMMGFDGKTLIHPKQIAAANAAFAPSVDAVAWADRVIAAHSEAVANGHGVVLLDGKLIENLHVAEARRLLALDAAIQAA